MRHSFFLRGRRARVWSSRSAQAAETRRPGTTTWRAAPRPGLAHRLAHPPAHRLAHRLAHRVKTPAPTRTRSATETASYQLGAVELVIAGQHRTVELGSLPTTTFKDSTVVALPTIWAAASSAAYNEYVFHFVGNDGFRPESRPNCASVVFDGPVFEKGYVVLESQRLVWDDALGFSGCASVTGLATIEATTK